MNKSILLLGCLVLAIQISAQQITVGNTNTWFLMINRLELSNKWTFTNEIHERTGNLLKTQGQFLLRPSFDFHLNKNIETSIGYSYIHVWPYSPYSLAIQKSENNLWEQVLIKYEIGKIRFQNRFRQENRWFDQIELNNGEYKKNGIDYANRFRFRFIMTFDVYKFEKPGRTLFINLWDEIWFNQDNHLRPTDFTRNWLYLGAGIKFDSKTNLQLAYLNALDKTGTSTFIQSSIIQLTFQRNFSLMKTE
jgi:hypothetical protein